jgi:hypothetical protein
MLKKIVSIKKKYKQQQERGLHDLLALFAEAELELGGINNERSTIIFHPKI